MFSFLSDANQFGISQAHAALAATIMAVGETEKFKKRFYIITAAVAFYGMIVSGTRGAIVVPGVGAIIYLLLSKNFKIIIIGFVLMLGVYIFFAHTTALNGVAAVNRMRSAFQASEDESFLVRMEK